MLQNISNWKSVCRHEALSPQGLERWWDSLNDCSAAMGGWWLFRNMKREKQRAWGWSLHKESDPEHARALQSNRWQTGQKLQVRTREDLSIITWWVSATDHQNWEKVDEISRNQLGKAFWLQALFLPWGFHQCGIRWEVTRKGASNPREQSWWTTFWKNW